MEADLPALSFNDLHLKARLLEQSEQAFRSRQMRRSDSNERTASL
jgi:hypothetical protein